MKISYEHHFLTGVEGTLTGPAVDSSQAALKTIATERVCAITGNHGSVTVWRDDSGKLRAGFFHRYNTISENKFETVVSLKRWLAVWVPKTKIKTGGKGAAMDVAAADIALLLRQEGGHYERLKVLQSVLEEVDIRTEELAHYDLRPDLIHEKEYEAWSRDHEGLRARLRSRICVETRKEWHEECINAAGKHDDDAALSIPRDKG
jgi:hypothetical protein